MVTKIKVIACLVTILASTFDLITDWLLYYEVSGIEQGLVFGPFSDAFLGFLILFCCIGTVTYIAELVLKVLDVFTLKENSLPSGLLDNINLASLWIEDVPLILMSVYIAGCRDTAVTVILLVKGLSTLLEVCANVGVIITKSINNKTYPEVSEIEENKTQKWLKIPFGIGLVIMMISSFLVFGLGNYFTESKNVVQLSSPRAFSYGKYSGETYLAGSGVYMHFDSNNADISMNTDEWIKLADLESITSSQLGTYVVSITYDSNPNTRLWIQSTSSSDVTTPESSTCFYTQTTPLSVLTSCSIDIPLTSTTTLIVFKFVYESPSSQKPLGDIFYHYRLASFTSTGSCTCTMATPLFSLRYFKAASNVDHTNSLVTLTAVSGEYYKSGSNLQAVSEVWKTGRFGCGHTGSSNPKQDTSISVPCLSWGPMVTSTVATTTITAKKGGGGGLGGGGDG